LINAKIIRKNHLFNFNLNQVLTVGNFNQVVLAHPIGEWPITLIWPKGICIKKEQIQKDLQNPFSFCSQKYFISQTSCSPYLGITDRLTRVLSIS
jgi:hypothetical protein